MAHRPSRSRCKVCGAPVYWGQKPGGGWHRPLEEAEGLGDLLRVDENGFVQPAGPRFPLFRTHVCKPENIKVQTEAKAAEAAIYFDNSSHRHVDVAVACPRCGAEVGERCRPLNPEQYRKANKFNGSHLVTPHKERVELADNA